MFLKNSLLISHPRLRAALSWLMSRLMSLPNQPNQSKGAGLSLLAFAVLVACGDEVTEVTEVNESGMKIIEKGEKLPSCTTDNEGALVYALDSAAAYACVNREWTSFKGKDGADGKDGRDGKDGEKGDKGDQGKQGEKGDAGKAGTSCTVEQLPDSSGFKVLCGGDSVGVVLNGKKGEKGDKGDKGDQGKDGKSVDGAENILIDARDKQIYRIVTIGTQTWMAENLNYKTDDSRCYNDSVEYCTKYGRLYRWPDAMDSAAVFSDNAKGCGYGEAYTIKTPARGICPEGWHIPTRDEWEVLYNAMGESPYAMQAKGFENWPDAIDAFGFSALPTGYLVGSYVGIGLYTFFWSATPEAFYWYVDVDRAHSNQAPAHADAGISVRCIKD